jgi:putative FmdB family regulatory protein
MPTYQYQCNDCGRDLEVVQRFSDPSLTICPSCEGDLRPRSGGIGRLSNDRRVTGYQEIPDHLLA